MSFTTIIVLILLAIIVWLWSINLRAREVAIAAVKTACKSRGLQLLDGTTHFYKCKPRRHLNGKLGIMRIYQFEYFDGVMRHPGKTSVFALTVQSVEFADKKDFDSDKTSNNVIQFPTKNNNRENH